MVLHRLVTVFEPSACKLNHKLTILAPRALILTPLAPTVVVLHRLVQVSERSTCKLNYAAAMLAPSALILKPWAPTVVLHKLF